MAKEIVEDFMWIRPVETYELVCQTCDIVVKRQMQWLEAVTEMGFHRYTPEHKIALAELASSSEDSRMTSSQP